MSKMGYVLSDRSDGSVELIETRPTVIATFANRAIADQMFAAFVAAKPLELIEEPAKPEAENTANADLTVPEEANTLPIAPIASATPTEGDWSDALRAVATGGNMNDIAETLGVTKTQLRGKYGAWCKVQKHLTSEALPERLRSVVSSMVTTEMVTTDDAKDACRLCGKEFTASIATDGCCARCAR